MKNGIYLCVVIFLGVMGYFVVNHLLMTELEMLSGIVYLLFSVTIVFLITNYKKRDELSPAHKFLNVTYVGLFALYGFIIGFNLIYTSFVEISALKFEAVPFILASIALVYGIIYFIKSNVLIKSRNKK
ncbi:MAG: hypothetical protein GY932_06425 [Arcobacter sp.]|nr:hypothetical protein [Arcobacter sp.]